MNKIVLGLILGGVLGAFDGMTAWFTPDVRTQIMGIIIGSTVKGIIAGILIGYFARKVHSLPLGILFGLGIGLLLAFFVAHMQGKYYFEIMTAWRACRLDRRLRHAEIRRQRRRSRFRFAIVNSDCFAGHSIRKIKRRISHESHRSF